MSFVGGFAWRDERRGGGSAISWVAGRRCFGAVGDFSLSKTRGAIVAGGVAGYESGFCVNVVSARASVGSVATVQRTGAIGTGVGESTVGIVGGVTVGGGGRTMGSLG